MSTQLNKNSIGIFPRSSSEDLTGSTVKSLTILAIESSCDETAIAIVKMENGTIIPLLSLVSSQVALHAQWGGVVPNLAAREHLNNITPLLSKSFTDAGISIENIDAIAVTQGPGLIPALLVGADFAKTLAYLWRKPLIGIHHIEGHIYSNFVQVISNSNPPAGGPISKQIPKSKIQKLKAGATNEANKAMEFPALVLVVSGGHTQLILMKDHLQYEIVGQTLDDAVGEAFDKVARILNIGYPGGPAVALRAQNFQFPISNFQSNLNDSISNIQENEKHTSSPNKANEGKKLMPDKLVFPRPMLNKNNFDFSFSGLKTAVLYETKKNPRLLNDDAYINAVCHEFQQACIDVLISKTLKAAEKFQPKTIMLAGGVSANKELRKQLDEAIHRFLPDTKYLIPDTSLTGDNAAMIGAAASIRWQHMTQSQKKDSLENWKHLEAEANLKLQ